MQIASQFANFSYGEADILRRAMSKRIGLYLKVKDNTLLMVLNKMAMTNI